ncbi:glutamate synthase subunit beta [Streptomyces sp. NRRL S-350]|uniref:glutamate synthase subunit beta n=1 Tax=Streptomyces sp. NRRL S-350 TaxID=1463902 RepID=UPI0004C1070F|nr:glutamate synthase subunit beta [Streptomyces sp. NRRL S-350]
MADRMAFLTTPRAERARRDARERLGDRNEVYRPGGLLPVISGQAERCMDCGLPFCHHACPLGNLVPEWNRLAAAGDWQAAAARLLATDNFPEFTGRLCPAPCESACVLAIDGAAVTIRNVELAIADRARDEGWDGPHPPERRGGYRVAVIGSGPAGLAAAQQLTRAGHATTVYERADRPGGLLRYGIPPFRLEKHRLERRLDQLRAEGTAFRTGVWVGRDVTGEELRAGYDALVVAVGATAHRELPVPGRELPGVHPAMDYLTWANRVDEGDCAASPVSAEGRHVVIVGGGDTAADCLGTALRQRAASVIQLDINPRPPDGRAAGQPWPVHAKVYRETTSHEECGAAGAGSRVFAAVTVGFEPGPDGRLVAVRFAEAGGGGGGRGDDGGGAGAGTGGGVGAVVGSGAEAADRSPRAGTERSLPAQLALLALGFTGPEPDQRLFAQLGLATGPQGTLTRDDGFGTATPGVFVAGDAGRGQSLIVWAIAEGRSAAAAVDRYLRGRTELPAPISASARALTLGGA